MGHRSAELFVMARCVRETRPLCAALASMLQLLVWCQAGLVAACIAPNNWIWYMLHVVSEHPAMTWTWKWWSSATA